MPRRVRKAPRRPRRKAQKKSSMTLVNRALHPIPARFITKMKYSEYVDSGALTGQYAFNLNSLFDPNRTGFGHQPYGFDTLATLYNRYRVISCGYRLQLAGDATSAFILSALPANEIVSSLSISEMRENPRCKYIQQNPGSTALTLSGKCYIPSLTGRTKSQYMSDDRYSANVTTSPAELAILNLQTANTADTIISTKIQVLLEFTVEWFDIKNLAQS